MWGENPLALYHFRRQGFYIYASTDEILTAALAKLGMISAIYDEIQTSLGDIVKIDKSGEIERGEFDLSHLNDWDFRYYSPHFWSGRSAEDPAEIKQLKRLAERVGVNGEHIDLLIDYGYTEEEIAELICVPNALQGAIDEILCEFAYCEEW